MDIEQARSNMVEQQLRPWQVSDLGVLELFRTVKREMFVPTPYKNLAFSDTTIPLTAGALNPTQKDSGAVMLPPKLEARLLQALRPALSGYAIEIGAGSGYFAALLSHRVHAVLSTEIHPELVTIAAENLKKAKVGNVTVLAGNGLDLAHSRTFEVIVLSGSVPFVPQKLLTQLVTGGQLVGFVGTTPTISAQRITRTSSEHYETEILFETDVPALCGFPELSKFQF